MINDRELPVQGQSLYLKLSRLPPVQAFLHQEIGKDGYSQPFFYTVDDGLVAGALPYGGDGQLLGCRQAVKNLPARTSLFPEYEILVLYLPQFL